MRKKIVLLLVGLIFIASLVLVACGEAEEEEEEEVITPPPGEEEELPPPGEEEELPPPPPAETPEYGGKGTLMMGADPMGFDAGEGYGSVNSGCINETLMQVDWTKGPAGTNETDFPFPSPGVPFYVGQLAESWEVVDTMTHVFTIRRGVYWALDPASEASRLVNGREFTADDVVFNFNRVITNPRSSLMMWNPVMCSGASIEKTGDWEVTVKCPVEPWAGYWSFIAGYSFDMMPPEVVEKYGNMQDWKNSVGTGPFMMADYVTGSSVLLKRNPNYWYNNPIGPGKGNQLPYMDNVEFLIIPDTSTMLAAMRTGKADVITVTWENADDLRQTAPHLESYKFLGTLPSAIHMRTDKSELPYAKKEVRQALMMGIDYDSLVNEYYGGEAEKNVFPFSPQKGFEDAYVPFEELPDNVQELYSHNPEKAKQLLANAGYPNGFQAKLVIWSGSGAIDMAELLVGMWEQIGVELTLDPKELGAYFGIFWPRSHEEMIAGMVQDAPGHTAILSNFRGVNYFNASYVDDPYVEEIYQQIEPNIIVNHDKVFELNREVTPYALEQAWVIPLPLPYSFTFWQPWFKNFNGVRSSGFNSFGYLKFIWIDQELKRELGF